MEKSIDFKAIHATPELQATNSSGRTKFWQGFVAEYGEDTVHYTTSWQELESGGLSKKNRSEFTKVLGKNIGRANETTPLDQAISELESLMNKKLDEGYHEEGTESTVLPLPMLAHKFVERGKEIKYPCFVQPKLDGHRALYDGKKFWTRKGKLYLPEVVEHLHFNTQGHIVDGEIMLPPGYTFQQTCSAIKKVNENTPKLQYHVFDIVDTTWHAEFTQRIDCLEEILASAQIDNQLPENIYIVKTILVDNEHEVAGWLSKALAKGYEGVMLRNAESLYIPGQRSVNLQKLKDFVDDEFLITGCTSGRGREDGAIIYMCKTESGDEFTVRPEGSVESRKVLFQQWKSDRWSPIGQKLTVRYQNFSDTGIPRFPVGIAIRED